MKRTENGKPVLHTTNGLDVVALDALAKLSGVSGGAVVKVLAALRMVTDYEAGKPVVRCIEDEAEILAQLVDFENVPQAMADEVRSTATQAYCRELAKALAGVHPLAEDLRITRCL
jgi:hypothetical protein